MEVCKVPLLARWQDKFLFVDLYTLARLVPIFVPFCTLAMAVPLAVRCGSSKIKSADGRYNCSISKN